MIDRRTFFQRTAGAIAVAVFGRNIGRVAYAGLTTYYSRVGNKVICYMTVTIDAKDMPPNDDYEEGTIQL